MKTIQSIHQPASLFVVPTMLYQFILKGLHTAEIKSIFSSGAKLSKEQFRAIAQLYPDTNLIEFLAPLRQVLLAIISIKQHQDNQ